MSCCAEQVRRKSQLLLFCVEKSHRGWLWGQIPPSWANLPRWAHLGFALGTPVAWGGALREPSGAFPALEHLGS